MNTAQRATVRTGLLDQGFTRVDFSDDITGRGDYTETFRHTDGTTVTINWAPKTFPATEVESLGEGPHDCPGMYDEPDTGLALPVSISEEEDRIS